MKIEISEQTFDVIQRMLNSDTFQISLNEAKIAAVAQQEFEVAAQPYLKQKALDAAIALVLEEES